MGLANFPNCFSTTSIIIQNEAFNQWHRRLLFNRHYSLEALENFSLCLYSAKPFLFRYFSIHFTTFNPVGSHMNRRTAEMLVGRNLKPPPFFPKAAEASKEGEYREMKTGFVRHSSKLLNVLSSSEHINDSRNDFSIIIQRNISLTLKRVWNFFVDT